MRKEFFYVYCRGILGVKTNEKNFRWVYGSVAPQSSYEEYENCIVKFDICVKPEKALSCVNGCDKRFQSYTWDSNTKTISCRRSIIKCLKIGFNIKVDGNTVRAEIGKNYYGFVRNRVMNLHGVYYLLADLANILLLKNKLLSLYASAVYSKAHERCVVLFAPPNTGKTLTAMNLCERSKCMLVAEDVLITDSQKVFACPWTASYRGKSSKSDDAGALHRLGKIVDVDKCESCNFTDVAVLSLGISKIDCDKSEVLQQIKMLNGYLFGYYSTPIVKILGYFDEEYRNDWNDCATDLLQKMIQNSNCSVICANDPREFHSRVVFERSGEDI